MTNIEKIRNMNDGELTKFLCDLQSGVIDVCIPGYINRDEAGDIVCKREDGTCDDCFTEWLSAKASADANGGADMSRLERISFEDLPDAVRSNVKEALAAAENRAGFAFSLLMGAVGERVMSGPEIYELYFVLSGAYERLGLALRVFEKAGRSEQEDGYVGD